MSSSTTPRGEVRRPPVVGVVVGLTVTVAAVAGAVTLTLVLLAGTGQLAASALFDAGRAVRYGLPAVRVVHDLAAALTVGALITATWLVGPEPGSTDPDRLDGVRERLTRWGSVAAVVWCVAGAVGAVLTAADVAGVGVDTAGFGTIVVSFLFQIDLGRALGISALLAGLAALLAWSAVRRVAGGWAAVVALLAVLPLSLAGHAASSGNHMLSVDSLALHLVGACVWIGGLVAVLVAAPGRSDRQRVVSRYSTLAGGCFGVVAASGVVNAVLRLGSPAQLGSPYGLLVLGKVLAVVVLGGLGAVHRVRTIRALDRRPVLFARLALVELVIMGLTIGLAVALSRSAPPAARTEVDPVTTLLGFPPPPPLTPLHYLTAFWPSLLWLVVAGGFAAGYLVWVVRLRRTGARWPLRAVVAWLLGCLLLVAATSGGIGVYGMVHVSAHLVQHLVLMLAVPALWVGGAPVVLARRAARPRDDGSLGLRETIDRVDRSAAVGLLSHPVVSGVVLLGGLLAFYATSLFELAISTHTGHVAMTTFFLAAGCLFVRSVTDPTRAGRSTRTTVLTGAALVLVGFGLVTWRRSTVLAPGWWPQIGQADDLAVLADQRAGGLVGAGLGVALCLAIAGSMIVGARRRSLP